MSEATRSVTRPARVTSRLADRAGRCTALLLCSLLATSTLLAQAPTQTQDLKARHSGAAFMGTDIQAMQRDDAQNPAMLWVKQGAALWQSMPQNTSGASTKSCAACHGDASSSMRGVTTRYPAFDAALKRPINLNQRINQCRQSQQHSEPWKFESTELLAMEAYLALQSRGLPIAPPQDERLKPFLDSGAKRYQQRMGQLNLSCAQCHNQRWGQRLGASLIPQAHPTAYPLYRLEWQGLGSLQRRLRNCMSGVRAQSYPLGAPELVELELYLAQQANGMVLEAPGVRP